MAYVDKERYAEARKRSYQKWRSKRLEHAKEYRKKLQAERPEQLVKKAEAARVSRQKRMEYMREHAPEEYRALRERTAQKLREYRAKTRAESPGLHIWREVKRRCCNSEMEFDIDPCDVVVPTHCPALGIPLKFNVGKPGSAPGSPSLDRIDPRRGYVKGNVQVLSCLANTMKNSASQDQLVAFAHWVLNTHGVRHG